MARTTKAPAPATLTEVRAWAKENGHEVADRGRISQKVRDAFTKKTKRSIVTKAELA